MERGNWRNWVRNLFFKKGSSPPSPKNFKVFWGRGVWGETPFVHKGGFSPDSLPQKKAKNKRGSYESQMAKFA
jgi:hypothetical protein